MAGINIDIIKAKATEFVEKYPIVNEPLTKLSDRLRVEKAYIAIFIAISPLLISLLLGWGSFLIDLIGFVYPVYASIKAVESKNNDEDSQWLTYWLIFGLFKIVEGVADSLTRIIPFYFIMKVGFLIWAYYPETKGASIIYKYVIKEYVVPAIVYVEKND